MHSGQLSFKNKTKQEKQVLAGMWRNQNPPHCGNVTRTATVKNSMVVSLKLKTELPYNPEVSRLGIHPKEWKVGSWR